MEINFQNLKTEELQPQNEFDKKVLEFITEFFGENSTVNVQTSGSTGMPKIFSVEKSRMKSSAEMTCDFLGLKPGDTALLCLPVEYISGKMMVARSVVRKLILKVVNTSLKPLENLDEYVDFCAMTPLQVENSLDKIHLIKNLIIGGAEVSESLKKKINEALGNVNIQTKIFETYGMSETLSHIALKEVYPVSEEWFTVFDNVQIGQDERGCLEIYAPKLNSELLKTNDLVELKNQKQFRFLGRVDNVINSGGAKIFPEQLESLVKQNIPNEVVFVGIPDETLGQKLTVVIEGDEDENLKSKILNLNFEKSFHKPKGIVFVSELPRTPNGKIDRLKLLHNLTSK